MSGYFGENLFFPEILGLKSCIMPPSSLVLEINWKREENGEGWGRGNPERECTQLCGIRKCSSFILFLVSFFTSG